MGYADAVVGAVDVFAWIGIRRGWIANRRCVIESGDITGVTKASSTFARGDTGTVFRAIDVLTDVSIRWRAGIGLRLFASRSFCIRQCGDIAVTAEAACTVFCEDTYTVFAARNVIACV